MIFQPITSLLQKPTVDFPTNNLATASKPNLTATKLQHNTQTTVSKKLLIYIYKTKPNETKAWLGAFYATKTQNRAKNRKKYETEWADSTAPRSIWGSTFHNIATTKTDRTVHQVWKWTGAILHNTWSPKTKSNHRDSFHTRQTLNYPKMDQ